MQKRELGSTGVFVNEIGYGSMNLANGMDRPSENVSIDILRRAIAEHGVQLIDTADSYGQGEHDMHYCERVIAKALSEVSRDGVVVATKGGFARTDGKWIPDGRPEHLRSACEGSLKALECETIDLYQLHRVDPNVPIADSLGELAQLQKEGKIRHIGVSNFSVEKLEEARKIVTITSVQNPLCFIWARARDFELVEYCNANNITLLAYAPLGGHRTAYRTADYASWARTQVSSSASVYTLALSWLLRLSKRIIPIPATTSLTHLRENMLAAEIKLSEAEFETMKRPRSWMEEYMEAKQRDDKPTAVTALLECLQMHPNEIPAWYDLSCLYSLMGQTDMAFEALNRAISSGFNEADALEHDEDWKDNREDARFIAIVREMRSSNVLV